MALTYTAIATVTVGSGGAATIEFTSIPNTFTDLLLKVSGRESGNGAVFLTNFNSDTGSNYSYRNLYGDGSSAASESGAAQTSIRVVNPGNVNFSSTTSNTFANIEIYIPNYTSSNNKSVSIDLVTENNATQSFQVLQAALWSSSNVISTITLDIAGVGNWVQYSTATLYGIKNTV